MRGRKSGEEENLLEKRLVRRSTIRDVLDLPGVHAEIAGLNLRKRISRTKCHRQKFVFLPGMERHEIFMKRCFDLARKGMSTVSPNPPVGAVLVCEGRIIGEGYHRRWGEPHAEVEAIGTVAPALEHLIPRATLYVSLEPCCIHGKTPPCTHLILDKGIKKVVISCLDMSPQIAGRGVALLRARGVEVHTGVLEEEGKWLVRFRTKWVTTGKPWVILKFARTKDAFMGLPDKQVWISNPLTLRLVHRWRSELDAIMVATNTAQIDDPRLTTRHWPGNSPVRIVLDRRGRLPRHLKLFDGSVPTLVVTERPEAFADLPVEPLSLTFDESFWDALLLELGARRITSLLVEGGSTLLHHVLRLGSWDEARVFTGNGVLGRGVPAPHVSGKLLGEWWIGDNTLTVWANPIADRVKQGLK